LHELGGSYHQIGMVYEEQRIWDQALNNYHKAIEWDEKTQQLHQLDSTYACVGLVLKAQGHSKKAQAELEKALAIAKQYRTGRENWIKRELITLYPSFLQQIWRTLKYSF